MKLTTTLRNFGIAAVTSVMALPAFAEVDTTELTAAKLDAVEVCGIVFGIIVAIAAFKYVRRAL